MNRQATSRPVRTAPSPVRLTRQAARHIWLNAQRLTEAEPFGSGPGAVAAAIRRLGYVQIDTINVVERCHHHILFSRIPAYRRADLGHAQSVDKSVFEYWTHALSYIPAEDFRFFVDEMKAHRKSPTGFAASTSTYKLRQVIRRIREEGPLAISDINDERLREKKHPWASRKPSKAALQAGFYNGQLVIRAREGMRKTYELTERHFGWERLPRPVTRLQKTAYLLDRALGAQGIVSLDSVCHLNAPRKPDIRALIERRVKAKKLVPVEIEGAEAVPHWARPEDLEVVAPPDPGLVHILSPFDPLIIQRRRTEALFGYRHLFEAYVTAARRQWGYFALPVLVGDRIVAAIDLKTDRQNAELRINNWVWMDDADPARHKPMIEAGLERFEAFQFGD